MLSTKQYIKRTIHHLMLMGRLAQSIYWPCALFVLLTQDSHPLPALSPAVVALAGHAVMWAQHLKQ